MSTWMLVLIWVLLVLGVVVAIAAGKPDTFRIERRATIAAPPEKIFAQINDLVAWQAWSPWARKDPNAKASFGPRTAGVGATFDWEGNREVGKGRMSIVNAQPPRFVTFRLDFMAPFKATNTAVFELTPAGRGTDVVWQMTGDQPLLAKIMCLFMNMDAMVGKDFEAGLANLKAIVERRD